MSDEPSPVPPATSTTVESSSTSTTTNGTAKIDFEAYHIALASLGGFALVALLAVAILTAFGRTAPDALMGLVGTALGALAAVVTGRPK